MKNFNKFFIFLSFTSCYVIKKKSDYAFKGYYYSEDSLHNSLSSFKIGSHNKFTFKWQHGLNFGKTNGVWVIVNDSTIVLYSNSLNQIKTDNNDSIFIPLRLTYNFNSDSLVLVSGCLKQKNLLNYTGWCRVTSNKKS